MLRSPPTPERSAADAPTAPAVAEAVVAWPLVGRVARRWPGVWTRGVRFVRFGLVGASGIVVNELALAIVSGSFGAHYLIGVVIATQVSSAWNFVLIERWAFRGHTARHSLAYRAATFFALNNAALLLRGPIIVGLTEGLGVAYLLSNLVSLIVLIVARFAFSDSVIWAGTGAAEGTAGAVAADVGAPAPGAPAPGAPAPVGSAGPVPAGAARAPAPAAVPTGATASTVADPDGRAGPAWAWALAVVAVVGVAIALRVVALGRFGFNSDEAVYAGQAATIGGDSTLAPFFPAFRAHPLLFQVIVSVLFRWSTADVVARGAAVAFGAATVGVTYLAGATLYGRRAGLIAAGALALMPYHVIVSRQVLLDGPMVFSATLALYFLGRYGTRQRPIDLYTGAAALGLTFLTKETGIVLAVAVYAFLALAPSMRTAGRQLLGAAAVLAAMVASYPVALALAGRTSTGQQYLAWQILRRPNHTLAFYLEKVPGALGWLVIGAAVAGVVALWRERSWRETLLGSWILVPFAFFEAWPVKGYQYLLPLAPAVAILAGRALDRALVTARGARTRGVLRWWGVVALVAVAASLAVPSWRAVSGPRGGTFVAASGGLPGGRETGEWIGRNAPQGSRILTLGPSMANVIQYYGRRLAFGLSVSSNPLHRNPVYVPVRNPDRMLRSGNFQYIVWDAYSARRSPTFSQRLLDYADRYHGRVVYAAGGRSTERGAPSRIVVFEVRP